jgi:hypothetical protein
MERQSVGEIFRYETKSSELILFKSSVITDLYQMPELCLTISNLQHAIHVWE